MKYIETNPSPNLRDLISDYWVFEVPKTTAASKPFAHELMPENTVSIVFINQPHYKGIRLLGPQLKKFQQQIYPGSTYLGIRFNPWVNLDTIIGNKKALINQTTESPIYLQDIFREIDVFALTQGFTAYHLLEKGLQRLVENKKIMIDPLVKYICLQLNTEVGIQELIKDIPLSIRPIQKKFKSTTGITMSSFRSIHRLQKTVKMIFMEKSNITNASLSNNYTDHAHFMNTFRKYMDSSVKNFLLHAENIELTLKK